MVRPLCGFALAWRHANAKPQAALSYPPSAVLGSHWFNSGGKLWTPSGKKSTTK